jgi:hypothetical protein
MELIVRHRNETAGPKRLYSSFLASLRESWKTSLPKAIPMSLSGVSDLMSLSGVSDLPRSATFHLELEAVGERVAPQVFLAFQASVRPWSAGHFTANVIVACPCDEPGRKARNPARLEDFDRGREGRYRLGKLVHGTDKWWQLAPYQESTRATLPGLSRPRLHKPPPWIEWVPSSFAEPVLVIAEAVDDVTADVQRLWTRAAARRS